MMFASYCAASYLSGSSELPPEVLENSAILAESPYNVERYQWRNGNMDSMVTESVVGARRDIGYSNLLELVGSTENDSVVAKPISCFDLLSTKAEVARLLGQLFLDSEVFLRANLAHRCVCGPMLGHSVQHITIAPLNSTADAPIMHIVNPIDTMQAAYDALDAEMLEHHNVNLSLERESDAYRYNIARGTFVVLRRDKLTLTMLTRQCYQETLTVRGALAHCVSRCLDRLAGIDVRARARMQWERGVTLNTWAFEVNEQVPNKDEL